MRWPTHRRHTANMSTIILRTKYWYLSLLRIFFAFLGYLTKEVSMLADTDLTDMFTFCLLARFGSKKSLLIIDFWICGGS